MYKCNLYDIIPTEQNSVQVRNAEVHHTLNSPMVCAPLAAEPTRSHNKDNAKSIDANAAKVNVFSFLKRVF
jgi:hypothetical protein